MPSDRGRQRAVESQPLLHCRRHCSCTSPQLHCTPSDGEQLHDQLTAMHMWQLGEGASQLRSPDEWLS